MTTKGTGPLKRLLAKRARRTKADVEELDQQIIRAVSENAPTSVRHTFYSMTNPRVPQHVPKTDPGYKIVQKRVVALRRNGRIPYRHIVDSSRRGHFVNTYANRREFFQSVAHLYRADIWAEAECTVEVWCESRSIAGVVQELCRKWAVDLYPCAGFPSVTFVHEATEGMNAAGRDVRVLYIGDYDPAGTLIDRKLEEEMRRHLDPDIDLEFRRIAINPEQIAAFDLPTKPRKKSEKRAPEIERTVEAEAMPAAILRGLLESEIEHLIDPRALKVAEAEEESMRDFIWSDKDWLDD